MKMLITQELEPQADTKVLDLFEANGVPPGVEQLYISADGREVIVIGDFDDMAEFHRFAELYAFAYAGPANFIPIVSPEVAVPQSRAGIEARS